MDKGGETLSCHKTESWKVKPLRKGRMLPREKEDEERKTHPLEKGSEGTILCVPEKWIFQIWALNRVTQEVPN